MSSAVPLDDILSGESAIVMLAARSADEVLAELALALARETGLSAIAIEAGLREREALGSTGLGHGLALPHAKAAEISGSRGVLGIAPEGISFAALDDRPVRVFVALISSTQPNEHLRALATVGRSFVDPRVIDRVVAAAGQPASVLAILRGEA
ncbi:PTS sugar transporter subunit IIA [Nannocystaceae bacterium ST9]